MKKIIVLGTALLFTCGVAFSQCHQKPSEKKECTEKCDKPCEKKDGKDCSKDSKNCKQEKETKGNKS